MTASLRWMADDLDALPQPLEDKRYELIDGILYVSTQPRWQQQVVCSSAASPAG